MTRSVLITGGAGFIGSHLVDALLQEGGWRVTVLDNFDPFYGRDRKERNLHGAVDQADFSLIEADLRDWDGLRAALSDQDVGGFDVIVHLAAKAGVRPSIEDPIGYQQANVLGTQHLLELARSWGTEQFVFASSSSVYGESPNVPWTEDQSDLRPISPYASTKLACEGIGHVYHHLYGLRFLALRFFTVYGPRQRPDLAIHKFADLMLGGEPIPMYGDGSSERDYTYVADTIQGVRAAMDYRDSGYEIINLGNDRTIPLRDMIAMLEDVLGVDARIERHPDQPGDVPQTWASVDKAERLLGYRPKTEFREGLEAFAGWLRSSNAD
jgi:UDP-glucuronate 4-epimerase